MHNWHIGAESILVLIFALGAVGCATKQSTSERPEYPTGEQIAEETSQASEQSESDESMVVYSSNGARSFLRRMSVLIERASTLVDQFSFSNSFSGSESAPPSSSGSTSDDGGSEAKDANSDDTGS